MEPRTNSKYLTFVQTVNPNDIVGREKDLAELHSRLSEHKAVLLVNGMGGVGKTTLAAAYVFKYAHQYEKIAWITQSEEGVVSSFIQNQQLLQSLQIQLEGKTPFDLLEEILFKLNNLPEQSKLLILDNTNLAIQAYLDQIPSPPNWSVLMTSREQISGAQVHLMELDFLSPPAAVELFKKHCSIIKDEALILEVVKGIEFHTLSIEILAKTAQYRRLDAKALKTALENNIKAGVSTEHSKRSKIERILSYLSRIFESDFSYLNDDEIWLMKQFVCLAPDFLPYEWLEGLINPSATARQEIFAKSLNDLSAKGWLLRKEEQYKMHRVIKEVTQNKHSIKQEDIQPLLDMVIGQLSIDQTKDNPIEKFHWIPFGQAMLSIFPNSTSEEISRLQNNLALVLQELGDFEGAKELLQKALATAKTNFGERHPTMAVSYSNLATVLRDLGDFQGAKELLQKAVDSDEANFGEQHPTMAVSYSNLALVLQDLGDSQRAKQLLQKALDSAEANFGEKHPTTAANYSNLALVLRDLGDYEEAKKLLQKALDSAEANFGEKHPVTAVSYSNLGTVLQDIEDFEGAKNLLEKAIASNEANFGEQHPTTAASYSNLALVLQELGDFQEAKELLEKVLDFDEANFGENHPTTAVNYSNLALVLKDLGDLQRAKQLLKKTIVSNEANFGEQHPTTAVSYSNLALVLQDLGDYQEALPLARKALLIFKQTLQEGHPYILQMEGNLKAIEEAMK